jgi:hypothetical protein
VQRYRGVSSPRVFFAGIPPEGGNANATLIDGINAENLVVSQQMVADGFYTPFVDVMDAVDYNLDFAGSATQNCPAGTSTPVHPNQCGYQHIAQAFEAVIGAHPTAWQQIAAVVGTLTAPLYPSTTNLFNGALVQTGFALPVPGSPSANVNFNVTNLMLVAGATQVITNLTTFTGFSGFCGLAWYDINQNPIGCVQAYTASTAITVPTGAVFLRMYYPNTVVTTATMVVTGSTLPGSYVPASKLPIAATLTTTAATTDTVTLLGMTSAGHCSIDPTNTAAATNLATTFISAKTTGQITVTHTATAGLVYDVVCSPY